MELRGHPQLSGVTGTLTSGHTTALCVPTMAVPLSSAPGPRPTGSWAGAHWAKGPATCRARGSTHARPSPSGPAGEAGCSGLGPCAPSPGYRADPAGVPGAPTRVSPAALIAALGGASERGPMRGRGVSGASPNPRCLSDLGTLVFLSGFQF